MIKTNVQHWVLSCSFVLWIANYANSESPRTALAVCPDRLHFLVGSQPGIDFHAIGSRAPEKRHFSSLDHVHDLRFSRDGGLLLVAGGTPAERGVLQLMEWPTMKMVRQIETPTDVIYQVASGESRVATACADGVCRVYDSQTGRPIAEFSGHSKAVTSLAFANHDDWVISCSVDGTIQIWESATGTPIRALNNHTAAVERVVIAASPDAVDSLWLASISIDRTIRLWDPRTGRMHRFIRLTTMPRAIDFDGTTRRWWVACDDKILVLDLENLEIIAEYQVRIGRIYEICVASSSRTAMVAGEFGIEQVSY